MQKAAKKPRIVEESVESKHTAHTSSVTGSINDIGSGVLTDLWKNLIGGSGKNATEQIFGPTPHARGGDLRPGEAMNLRDETKQAAPRSEGHMEYFSKIKSADVMPKRQEDASVEKRVEEIRFEIKQLMKTSKQLETTFKSVQIEQKIVNAGKYHETLFDFIKALLRSARVRMEEGLSWSNTAKGKKQQKQYWNMFKKHGTTFGLSNERTVATQTG